MNVAGCLGRLGYKVLLVDADPQVSAMEWRMNHEENLLSFEIRAHPFPTIHKDLPRWPEAETHDIIIIDCPPGGQGKYGQNDNVTRSAILASNIVLIPVRPSPLDYQASIRLMPLLDEIHQLRPELKAFLVINSKPPGKTRISAAAKDTARRFFSVEGFAVGILETELFTRTAYVEVPITGKTVVDYDPTSKASLEIQNLTQEILLCLNPTTGEISATSGAR